jgi:hypothetical protein
MTSAGTRKPANADRDASGCRRLDSLTGRSCPIHNRRTQQTLDSSSIGRLVDDDAGGFRR